jgi:hypothetical protein
MRNGVSNVGRVVAALGAVGLFASLFMPWYGPPSTDYLTIFGDRTAFDWFLGKHNPDGWQALAVIDIYLAGLAAVAVLMWAFCVRRAARTVAGATAIAAAVGVGLIVYRLKERAAPFNEPIYGPAGKPTSVSSWVEPRIGIYVALGGAAAILVGSILVNLRYRVTRIPAFNRGLPESAR